MRREFNKGDQWMTVLGLTGGYCAGKNEAAALLEERGWRVCDVDKLGHRALAESVDALVEAFGDSIAAGDRGIDRARLGKIVFADQGQLKKLESIVHPAMYALLDREIEAAARQGADRFCINAALLYRFPHRDICRAIIEVRAPLYARLARAQARDHISDAEALKRIASQREFWNLRPQAIPLFMLWNTGSRERLRASLAAILAEIES